MAAKPTPPAPAEPTAEELDERDACALVQAAEQAVKAIESMRSRMVGKRDATPATGHVLEAIAHAGGSLREYDRPHVWALRHAVGGETHVLKSPHDAAAQVLATVVHSLRGARSEDEAARQNTARSDMLAMAKVLKGSEHMFEATRNLEQHDAGVVVAKAAADKAAHEARLAAGYKTMQVGAPAPAPAAKATGKAAPAKATPGAAPDGDYVLEGSADGPDGNPFPTAPVG